MAQLIRTTWCQRSILGILPTKCIYVFPLLPLLITGFQGVDGKVKIGSYYSSIGLGILNKPSQDGDGPLTVRQT